MKIIYFGTGSFAVPTLEGLSQFVSLVVTQPDRPSGRTMKLQPTAVKLAAQRLGIAVEAPEKSRSPEFVERLRAENADFLLVASYGQILSEAVLSSAARGGINLHGSILPHFRGAAPIQRAIEAGDTETGITLMQMDKGMDTGDVIAIVKTPIGPDETYGELQNRLADLAAKMATEWGLRILENKYPRTPQDSNHATVAPKVHKAETQLNLSEPGVVVYNRFRAFTPNPGTSIHTTHGRIKLLRANLSKAAGTPGTIVALKPNVTIACGSDAIELVEVQPEGKRPMDARSWANGARLRIGDNLLA